MNIDISFYKNIEIELKIDSRIHSPFINEVFIGNKSDYHIYKLYK